MSTPKHQHLTAFPVLMKKIGVIPAFDTKLLKRARAYALKACRGHPPKKLPARYVYEGKDR